jgi:2'-hydroxyisoflavone reductase
MHSSRRSFLKTSALSAGAVALGAAGVTASGASGASAHSASALLARAGGRSASLKILILGGTGFLGPACIEAALAKGHKVTVFNRGARETMRKERGRPSAIPEGVEVLYGNRDPEKTADDWKEGAPPADGKARELDPNSPKGLSQLEGKKWDGVIDTSAYFPRIAKASAELLAPNVSQYLFISTISVYKSNDKPGSDETAELNVLSDPTTESFGAQMENYGAGKAACEAAIEAVMPGRVTNIRPGFIVGPRDTSRRYAYWAMRIRKGGEVLVPGEPTDPIQIIDVRDLADWCVHCLEKKVVGVYNATGPDKELSMKAFVEGTREGAKSDATFTWVPNDVMEANGMPLGSIPLYLPPTGATAGFHRVSVSKAVANGLKFRSPAETARAKIEWLDTLPADVLQGVGYPGFPAEKEAEILKAFKEKK